MQKIPVEKFNYFPIYNTQQKSNSILPQHNKSYTWKEYP